MPTARAFLAWAIPLSFCSLRGFGATGAALQRNVLGSPSDPAYGIQSPAGCRTAMLRRFRTFEVGVGNDQGRKRRFIVAPGGLGPDVIRHRVRPVAHRVRASLSARAARSASVK